MSEKTTKNEERAEKLYLAEADRLSEDVRFAEHMHARAEQRLTEFRANRDSFIAYKAAILDLTGST